MVILMYTKGILGIIKKSQPTNDGVNVRMRTGVNRGSLRQLEEENSLQGLM